MTEVSGRSDPTRWGQSAIPALLVYFGGAALGVLGALLIAVAIHSSAWEVVGLLFPAGIVCGIASLVVFLR